MLLHPEPQDGNNDSDPEEISLQLANRMMKEKSRMLLHPEPQDGNNDSDPEEISLQLANRMMEGEELSSEDRKAITLKEAFDRTINKLGSEMEEEEDPETMDAERLRSMSQEYS